MPTNRARVMNPDVEAALGMVDTAGNLIASKAEYTEKLKSMRVNDRRFVTAEVEKRRAKYNAPAIVKTGQSMVPTIGGTPQMENGESPLTGESYITLKQKNGTSDEVKVELYVMGMELTTAPGTAISTSKSVKMKVGELRKEGENVSLTIMAGLKPSIDNNATQIRSTTGKGVADAGRSLAYKVTTSKGLQYYVPFSNARMKILGATGYPPSQFGIDLAKLTEKIAAGEEIKDKDLDCLRDSGLWLSRNSTQIPYNFSGDNGGIYKDTGGTLRLDPDGYETADIDKMVTEIGDSTEEGRKLYAKKFDITKNDPFTFLFDKGTSPMEKFLKKLPSYPGAWKSDTSHTTLRIGYTLLDIAPENIHVMDEAGITVSPTLRSEGSVKKGDGSSKKYVTIGFTCVDREEINTILLQILRQQDCCPFLPVGNYMLNTMHGIDAIAIQNISVNTVPGTPNVLQVTISGPSFYHEPYLSTPIDFTLLWNFPLFKRWANDPSRLTDGKLEHKYQPLTAPMTSKLSFEMPDEEGLKLASRQVATGGVTPDIKLNYLPVDIGNPIWTSLSFAYSNNIAEVPRANEFPAYQFTGKGDTMFKATAVGTQDDVQALTNAFDQYKNLAQIYRGSAFGSVYGGYMRINNELTKLAGVDWCIPLTLETRADAGHPGYYEMDLQFISYSVVQNRFEGIIKETSGTGISTNNGRNLSNGIPYGSFMQDYLLEESLGQRNAYPDLYLPTMQKLNQYIDELNAHNDFKHLVHDFWSDFELEKTFAREKMGKLPKITATKGFADPDFFISLDPEIADYYPDMLRSLVRERSSPASEYEMQSGLEHFMLEHPYRGSKGETATVTRDQPNKTFTFQMKDSISGYVYDEYEPLECPIAISVSGKDEAGVKTTKVFSTTIRENRRHSLSKLNPKYDASKKKEDKSVAAEGRPDLTSNDDTMVALPARNGITLTKEGTIGAGEEVKPSIQPSVSKRYIAASPEEWGLFMQSWGDASTAQERFRAYMLNATEFWDLLEKNITDKKAKYGNLRLRAEIIEDMLTIWKNTAFGKTKNSAKVLVDLHALYVFMLYATELFSMESGKPLAQGNWIGLVYDKTQEPLSFDNWQTGWKRSCEFFKRFSADSDENGVPDVTVKTLFETSGVAAADLGGLKQAIKDAGGVKDVSGSVYNYLWNNTLNYDVKGIGAFAAIGALAAAATEAQKKDLLDQNREHYRNYEDLEAGGFAQIEQRIMKLISDEMLSSSDMKKIKDADGFKGLYESGVLSRLSCLNFDNKGTNYIPAAATDLKINALMLYLHSTKATDESSSLLANVKNIAIEIMQHSLRTTANTFNGKWSIRPTWRSSPAVRNLQDLFKSGYKNLTDGKEGVENYQPGKFKSRVENSAGNDSHSAAWFFEIQAWAVSDAILGIFFEYEQAVWARCKAISPALLESIADHRSIAELIIKYLERNNKFKLDVTTSIFEDQSFPDFLGNLDIPVASSKAHLHSALPFYDEIVRVMKSLGSARSISPANKDLEGIELEKSCTGWKDEISYMPAGRLLMAYPTVHISLNMGGNWLRGIRFFDMFYGMFGCISVDVAKSRKDPADTCEILLSNSYQKLSNTLAEDKMTNALMGALAPGQGFRLQPASKDNKDFNEAAKGYLSTIGEFVTDAIGMVVAGPSEDTIRYWRAQELNSLMIRPGVRLHIRMGYGANPSNLAIVFNGRVAQTDSREGVMTLIGLGDGAELENSLGENKYMNAGLLRQPKEPRNILSELLTATPQGSMGALTAITRTFQGVLNARNKYGIENFGTPHYNPPESDNGLLAKPRAGLAGLAAGALIGGLSVLLPPVGIGVSLAAGIGGILGGLGGIALGATDVNVNTLIMSDGECGVNLYTSSPHALSNTSYTYSNYVNVLGLGEVLGGYTGICVEVENGTPWDVIRCCQLAVHDYIAAVVPFGSRSTLFYGMGHFPLFYSYTYNFEPGIKAEIEKYGGAYAAMQAAMLTSVNPEDITVDPNRDKETGEVIVGGGAAHLDQGTLIRATKNIYAGAMQWKQFRQYHMISTGLNLISNNMELNSEDVYTQVAAMDTNGVVGNLMTFDPYLCPEDQKTKIIKTNLYTSIAASLGSLAGNGNFTGIVEGIPILKNWLEEFGAVAPVRTVNNVAANYMRESLMGMYKGGFLILGNAGIKPYDICYINDAAMDMQGPIIAKEVAHHFSAAHGYVTVVAPDALVMNNNDNEMLAMVSILSEIFMAVSRNLVLGYGMKRMARNGVLNLMKSALSLDDADVALLKQPDGAKELAKRLVERQKEENLIRDLVKKTRDPIQANRDAAKLALKRDHGFSDASIEAIDKINSQIVSRTIRDNDLLKEPLRGRVLREDDDIVKQIMRDKDYYAKIRQGKDAVFDKKAFVDIIFEKQKSIEGLKDLIARYGDDIIPNNIKIAIAALDISDPTSLATAKTMIFDNLIDMPHKYDPEGKLLDTSFENFMKQVFGTQDLAPELTEQYTKFVFTNLDDLPALPPELKSYVLKTLDKENGQLQSILKDLKSTNPTVKAKAAEDLKSYGILLEDADLADEALIDAKVKDLKAAYENLFEKRIDGVLDAKGKQAAEDVLTHLRVIGEEGAFLDEGADIEKALARFNKLIKDGKTVEEAYKIFTAEVVEGRFIRAVRNPSRSIGKGVVYGLGWWKETAVPQLQSFWDDFMRSRGILTPDEIVGIARVKQFFTKKFHLDKMLDFVGRDSFAAAKNLFKLGANIVKVCANVALIALGNSIGDFINRGLSAFYTCTVIPLKVRGRSYVAGIRGHFGTVSGDPPSPAQALMQAGYNGRSSIWGVGIAGLLGLSIDMPVYINTTPVQEVGTEMDKKMKAKVKEARATATDLIDKRKADVKTTLENADYKTSDATTQLNLSTFTPGSGIDWMNGTQGMTVGISNGIPGLPTPAKGQYLAVLPQYTAAVQGFNPKLTPDQAKAIASITLTSCEKTGFDPRFVFAILHTESHFRPDATGPVTRRGRAEGIAQIMPTTARGWGVSNAYDPVDAIKGAAMALAKNYTSYRRKNNQIDALSLTAAAYNAGAGAVQKHNGIPPFAQTVDYVKKVISAYSSMVSSPALSVGKAPLLATIEKTPTYKSGTDSIEELAAAIKNATKVNKPRKATVAEIKKTPVLEKAPVLKIPGSNPSFQKLLEPPTPFDPFKR